MLCRRAVAAPFRAIRQAQPCLAPRRSVHAQAATAGPGDFVAVDYTGTLDDGTVFDSSRKEGRTPLEFQIGGGRVIKGFDKALTGLAVGENRKVRLDPEDAYGPVQEEAIITLPPTSKVPEGLKEGDRVGLSNGMQALVTKIDTETGITLDCNHELAGKHLTFDVTLVSLSQAAKLQTITFGAGCFWGPQLAFQRVPGVISTEVGYSQGNVPNPTYDAVCSGQTGHVEVVQVTYDPDQLPLSNLLDEFWKNHDPTSLNKQGNDSGTQYRAGIYTSTPEQLEEAKQYLDAKRAAAPGLKIVTELEPLKEYYKAEEYHQEYLWTKGGRGGRPQDPSKGCKDPIRCYG